MAIRPKLAVGLETDLNLSGVKGGGASFLDLGNAQSLTQSVDERIKWFGTVRGRLGYLVTNNLLAYATGGLAYGRVEQSLSDDREPNGRGAFVFRNNGFSIICGSTLPCFTGSSTRTAIGWTAGGGFEYKLADRWSVKTEYIFVNLGKNNVNETATRFVSGTIPASFTSHFSDTSLHVVRVGLNYGFGADRRALLISE